MDGLRTCLLPFITSEWAELVPFFLGRLLPAVQALPPGVSLTEPPAVNPSAPNVAPATAPVPLAPGLQTVTSSRPSPPAPANTRLASASSGPSQLVQPPAHPSPSSPRGSNAKRTSRCTRPSSPPVSPPVASGSGSAAVARPATTPSAQPQMPIDCHPGTRPDGWVTCNRCKKRKQRCAPPAGSARPFTSCTRCLLNKVECVRGPVEAVVHRAYRLQVLPTSHQLNLRPFQPLHALLPNAGLRDCALKLSLSRGLPLFPGPTFMPCPWMIHIPRFLLTFHFMGRLQRPSKISFVGTTKSMLPCASVVSQSLNINARSPT